MARGFLGRTAAACVLAATMLAAAPGARAGWFDGGDARFAPFIDAPKYRDAALSPDGSHLATILYDPEHGSSVEMIDLDKNTEWAFPLIRSLDPAAVTRAHVYPYRLRWVADDAIAVDFSDHVGVLFAVSGRLLGLNYKAFEGMVRVDGESTESIVVTSFDGHSLRRASRANGWKAVPFSIGLPDKDALVLDWKVDASGALRIVRCRNDVDPAQPRIATWYRRAEQAPWRKIDERAYTDDPFVPVAVGPADDRIIVQARNGGDLFAIWNFDVDKRAFLDSVASQPDADVVETDDDTVRGGLESVVADGLRPRTVWFDARMARLQAMVDAALPDHVNALQAGRSHRILVQSWSDIDAGQLYVLDATSSKMQHIGALQPQADPARMQPMQSLHYPSFDGMTIPAYLTLPGKPARPVPLIVLIHGGPQRRDRWGWNAEVQAFAAHGYAVFQPQFRGSSGFGRRLEEAGYGQWGLGMQDDITAGVHYLIDQHIADPRRICIVGASYGGYAALWGLAKTPELYRCGVSIAGVSDIEHQLNDNSDASRSQVARAFMRSRVGDPALMKATWDSVSPLKHADRIQAPLLLVHGDEDVRVPISHSGLMMEAMQARHKDVVWLDFPGEGHNVFAPDNQVRYYEEVFKLFDRTIGKGEPPATR
jgi:dipeptidyl aminopeptidase/acylaminoacyl peptidase